ncbi:adhesion G protein-coupled receptor L3 [Trichonephila clavata]|uniref:Adhesion G protein-coupled receptor L3 n=1 Tax=Trichonephila clavata TaxID=2740835 RepID=A0A8X6J328_TRICU|nr:adhesion G protein-coupled receptor L3 [Trichonephila clavata]
MNCQRIIIRALVLSFTWTQMELKKFSEPELAEMKRKWEECCRTNVCLQNSCYTAEWKASAWTTIRQRCQGRYPDWPYTVDIFRIQNQADIEILTKMFQRHSEDNSSFPHTIWTSGMRCPKTGNEGPVLVTRWVSTNRPLPDWLEEKTDTQVPYKNEGCKFLVIYPAPNVSHTKYDFQDQTARHAAICEFLFPGDLENQSESEDETDLTKTFVYTQTTSHSLKSSTTLMSIQSKTLNPTQSLHWSSSIGETPKEVTHAGTEPYQMTSTPITDRDSNEEFFPTKDTRFCKGQTEAGIQWPDAPPGVTVNQSCPEGMIGYAHWTCSEWTLLYTPERPHIQDCKHIWIRNLEDDVNQGVDAVKISLKLANETKHQILSHGDITALVDLSTEILSLYYKQSGMEETSVSYSFTGSMIASMSNILRAEIKTAWEALPEIHQTRAASQILKLVTNMGSYLSCTRRSTNKLQFTVTAENIGLQTFILKTNASDDEDLIVFPEKVPGVETTSSLSLHSDFDTESWLSPCKNYKTAVGIIYNHVGDFLKTDNVFCSTAHVVTKVISFSLTNDSVSIRLPKGKEVTVVLQHALQKDIQLGLLRYPRCMFWNFSKQNSGQWDGSGCYVMNTNTTHTVCSCNHLTNFAVLMDINDIIKEDEIQSIMTYVCCGVSSLTLIGTLICFLTIRSLRGRRSIITGNLCFCLLFINVLIIFGLDQTHKKAICATIAGLLHFWTLSAFCWMLVEGYHLYKMVVLVFQRGENLPVKFYYLFAYGSPLVVVGISASIRSEGYGGHNYCWLSSHHGLMWSFVGPACVILFINIGIFILTLQSASNVRIKREQTTLKKIKSWARGSLSVTCLLGLTWCLGLFYINETLHVFSYVFILLNGLQDFRY